MSTYITNRLLPITAKRLFESITTTVIMIIIIAFIYTFFVLHGDTEFSKRWGHLFNYDSNCGVSGQKKRQRLTDTNTFPVLILHGGCFLPARLSIFLSNTKTGNVERPQRSVWIRGVCVRVCACVSSSSSPISSLSLPKGLSVKLADR